MPVALPGGRFVSAGGEEEGSWDLELWLCGRGLKEPWNWRNVCAGGESKEHWDWGYGDACGSRERVERAEMMEGDIGMVGLTSYDRDGCEVGRFALLEGDCYGLGRRRRG